MEARLLREQEVESSSLSTRIHLLGLRTFGCVLLSSYTRFMPVNRIPKPTLGFLSDAELERQYFGDAGWQTVEATGGGGSGSQNLAQVLAEGGDPDGNPVTGALTISPTDAVPANYAQMLRLANTDDAEVFVVDSAGEVAIVAGDPGAYLLTLQGGALTDGKLIDAYVTGDSGPVNVFQVGPTGAVIIIPSDAAAEALKVAGVEGSSSYVFQAYNNDNDQRGLDVSGPEGAVHIQVDSDDNASLSVSNAGAGPVFSVAPRPVVPLTLPVLQDVITALKTLGLIAQHD